MIVSTVNMTLPPDVAAEPSAGGYLLYGSRQATFREAEFGPISIDGLSRYMGLCLFNTFMSEPKWGSDLSNLPDQCQFVLWVTEEGRYGILVPLLSGDFRTRAKGTEGGLALFTECGPVGHAVDRLPLAYVRYGDDPYLLVEHGMAEVVRMIGVGRLRTEKMTPDFVNYLGWCTWDAFYLQVDEEKIVQGMQSFRESGIMPGFVIVDEGWQDCTDDHFLLSYGARDGYADRRIKSVVDTAKQQFGVRYVACWRTLFGELRGIKPGSAGLGHLKAHIVDEPNTDGATFGVVEPEDVRRFQDEYAAHLARDGVDFVKVDFQAALYLMTYDHAGRVGAMTNWQYALQDSVKKHFGGQMINCMSGTTDAVYNYRDSSVTRSSDDFGPGASPEMQPRHIVQNAFNGLCMGSVCICDWDMFWSEHPWAEYHAAGRAISGGPVYVSDKPGHTGANLLKRLVAADGRVLKCNQPALPTRDILFVDYVSDNVLLKAFNTCGEIGLLGVFHPHPEEKGTPITESISPRLVEPLVPSRYAAYSVRNGFLGMVDYMDTVSLTLAPREADVIVFSPILNGFAALGLIDKLNPAAAVLDISVLGNSATIEMRGGGRAAVYCKRPVKEVLLDGEACEFEVNDSFLVIDTGDREMCKITVNT